MYDRPVWVEIDLGAIAANTRALKQLVAPQTKLMAIVKANAYGHGAVEVARTALNNGAEQLGVAIIKEGCQLRRAGFGVPILILGYTPPEQAIDVVKNNLTQTVYSLEDAKALSWAAVQQRKTVRVHIKIDTGMSRIGFSPGPESVTKILEICRLPNLTIEGIFTHFAAADSQDKSFTQKQYTLFMQMLNQLEQRGLQIPIKHCANSAAIIDLPEANLDMVRAGISLYGYYPSTEVDASRVKLKPALTLKARVAHVKEVPQGTSISYGCTYVTPQATKIATIPIGYADGYLRSMSNRGEMLLRGQKVPVVGRVCMDQCMIDVGSLPDAQVGEEVVLIGAQGAETITTEDVAQIMGTINYEVLCMIGPRVPRIYIA